MFCDPNQLHAAGRGTGADGQVLEADGASRRVFVPQSVKIAVQDTVKAVGLTPTQGAIGLRAGAIVVTDPLEKYWAALHQIHRSIGIGTGDDVDGITDEAWIGST